MKLTLAITLVAVAAIAIWTRPLLCLVIGSLREAEAPLSQTEIVRRMLAKRGVSEPTPANLRDMRNAVHATLPRYEGTAIKSTGKRESRRWAAIA